MEFLLHFPYMDSCYVHPYSCTYTVFMFLVVIFQVNFSLKVLPPDYIWISSHISTFCFCTTMSTYMSYKQWQ